MNKCDKSGSECSALGVKILGLNNEAIDLTTFQKVKAEKLTNTNDEMCIKFKHEGGGGKLESEDCDKKKSAACFVHCSKHIQSYM